MAKKIDPISGFPEYLPAQQLAFNAIVAKITGVYQSFGFVPLETAAVERINTLTSKGIDSKEVYALRRLNVGAEDGDKDLALRFDLTVPLARYMAQNYGSLSFPFRRYQVQPVWRGERAQKGRYRQFHQFDIDTIADGQGNLPLEADAEIIAAAHQALTAILPAGQKFTMRVNNRKLLQWIISKSGFSDAESPTVIKIIDDFDKLPIHEIEQKLSALNANADISFLLASVKSKNPLSELSIADNEGLHELQILFENLTQLLGKHSTSAGIEYDGTIARGLDYYTGTVVETRLHAAPELGSICSGGRYDNLAESLSDRQLPGVGISIGLSRLAVWLMDQQPYASQPAATAQVIVTGQNAPHLCQILRGAGIAAEMALGAKSAGQHFQAAQKRGLGVGVVGKEDGSLAIRSFATRQEIGTTEATLAADIAPLLTA